MSYKKFCDVCIQIVSTNFKGLLPSSSHSKTRSCRIMIDCSEFVQMNAVAVAMGSMYGILICI